MDYLAAILLMLTGLFLILLVLVQRGRGGGLAGAFGGMGGSSAFGTKAGDVFTKITVIAAIVWVVLAGLSILAFSAKSGGNYSGGEDAGVTASALGEEGDLDSMGNDKKSDDDNPDTKKPEKSTTTEKPSSESTKKSAPETSESSEKPE